MTKLARRITAFWLAMSLLVVLAMPVLASVIDSGTQYCSAGYIPYARSYSTGFTELRSPGSGYAAYDNGSTWTVRKKLSPVGEDGGYWEVEVTGGSLNDPGTYAGCQNAS